MKWERKHLLTLQELNPEEIELILDTASSFLEVLQRPIRKVPTLRGKTVVNLFFEPSTRTRISFVTIVGDIRFSRVARSNIWGLTKLGAEVRLVSPPTLFPPYIEKLGVKCFYSLEEGIKDADVIMALRLQRERQNESYVPSIREYRKFYGITLDRLKWAKEDVIIMHPGPINRGIELDPEVADSQYSVILEQVTNGVAVRMAILYLLLGGES